MATYRVYGIVTGSKFLGEVEADSEEEAKEKALDLGASVNLCHHCTSECDDAQITSYEVWTEDEGDNANEEQG